MITLYVLLTLAASVFVNGKSYECSYRGNSENTTLSVSQCSDLNVLKFIPKLKYLDVSSCNSDFKMDVLPPMAELRRIRINNCHISELKKKQFENLFQLNELDLGGNFIEKLSNESFHKLSSLNDLYLHNNSIEVLPEGVFNTLEYLHTLDLSFNKLSNLSKDIFLGNRYLMYLYLKGNPLRTIHLENPIGNGFVIFELDLTYCDQLRDMRVYANMNNLYLENSGLEKLEIRGRIISIKHKNSKVTHADLHGTEFENSFPEVLCRMPSLEWLDLSNSIDFLKYYEFQLNTYVDCNGNMCDFPNLRFLNLSGIRIRSIPRRLPLFGHNLTTLDLSHNMLNDESLHDIFYLDAYYQQKANFSNLSFLNMSGNEVKHLPRKFPLFGPNLITLDLSHNLLEDVSLESFAEAHSLQNLYLEGNRLISFDYKSVCDGLKNLKQLALFDNLLNATFYDEMTNYFDHTELHLIQKENIIIKTVDQEKHRNSNEKSNQILPRTQDDFNHVTPTTFGILSKTENQEKHENLNEKANQTLPRTQDDFNYVTPKASGILSGKEDQKQHNNSIYNANQTLPRTQDDFNYVTPTASGILSGTEDHQPSIKVFIIMSVLMIIININNC